MKHAELISQALNQASAAADRVLQANEEGALDPTKRRPRLAPTDQQIQAMTRNLLPLKDTNPALYEQLMPILRDLAAKNHGGHQAEAERVRDLAKSLAGMQALYLDHLRQVLVDYRQRL